jgi:hypothetical protein
MQSENSARDDDLLPFGAPQADSVDPAVRAKLTQASSGKQKIQRSPRALRPLWYSIPILLIALVISAYLIGMTLWSRSSLGHWTKGEYPAAQAGYEGQMTWTSIGIERWVSHYNLGTTLVRQDAIDEGVAELRTAYDLVPKATEVQPGRLEPFSYECRVRVNLGIGIEIQADALRSAKSLDDAIAAYQEAVDLISPCQTAGGGGGQSGQSGGQGQSGNQSQSGGQGQSGDDQQSGGSSENPADENKSRVQKKKEDTEKEQQGEDPNQKKQDPQNNQDPKPNPSSSPTPSNSPTSDPYEGENSDEKQQRQKLEDQNSGRAKERRDQTDDKRSGNPNGAW